MTATTEQPRSVPLVPDVAQESEPATRPPEQGLAEAFAFVRAVKDYAIFMLDPDGRILTWNEGARLIKGYEASEVVGTHFSRFFPEEARARGRPAELLARAAADGRVEDEAWRMRRSGGAFWANVVITAVRDDAGQLRGFVKVTRDLTERRHAEELLRQSEERMRLLVESVKDYAIYMLDAEGRITTWNSGAERIKGYRANEVIGTHFGLFYPERARAAGHPEHELQVAVEQGRYEEEGLRVRKGGEEFVAHVVLTAIHDPDTGRLRGFAKVTRDLTERRRIEEQAERAREQAMRERLRAEEAQGELQRRDEFISIAAHELRTPLTALALKVDGVSHALRLANDGGRHFVATKVADRLEGAMRQIHRLSELVERLLDVSRVVRGTLAMQLEDCDLGEVVLRVADDLRDAASHARSELRVTAADGLTGSWDRAHLEQVVVNLLSNAIKFGEGKPIVVTAEPIDTGVRLVVTDHGIGIAPEDTRRIFDRFERAASVRRYGGLGLGLYITKNIVEAHGGSIGVSSRLGEGASFIVELPRQPDETLRRRGGALAGAQS